MLATYTRRLTVIHFPTILIKMKTEVRSEALRLRLESNMSYSQIRKQLQVSKSTLSYWLRDFPLSEARIAELKLAGWTNGEASRERFRKTMREIRDRKAEELYRFQLEKMQFLPDIAYYTAGLMLYLAEGDKKNIGRISIANTDYRTIRFFMRWLEKFMDVDLKRVKVQLHLYETMDIHKEMIFWTKSLDFRIEQFYKPSIRPVLKNSFNYRESYRHGTCSTYYLSTEKKTELMMAISAFLKVSEKI